MSPLEISLLNCSIPPHRIPTVTFIKTSKEYITGHQTTSSGPLQPMTSMQSMRKSRFAKPGEKRSLKALPQTQPLPMIVN
jgi:hypothetical protein